MKNTNVMTHIIVVCVIFGHLFLRSNRTVIFDHVRNALFSTFKIVKKEKRGLTIHVRDTEIRILELFLYFIYFYTDAIRRYVF